MKTYNEYLQAAGDLLDYPSPVYVWFAYKDGTATKCRSLHHATTISNNIEEIETKLSIENRKHVHDHNANIEREALSAWYKDFRNQHSDLCDSEFSIIYDEAYDQAHSYGYDAVAEKFETLKNFLQRFNNAFDSCNSIC